MSGVRLETDMSRLREEDLRGFFVGWPNPPLPADHLALLRNSAHAIVAFDEARVVGFITAISDGVLSAYIPLLEVLPEYQGAGIGTLLVETLLHELAPLYMVDVTCDAELATFYERFDMAPSTAMIRRNYDTLGQ